MLAQTSPQVRIYDAGASMGRHEHDGASLSLVIHGGFLEHIGRRTRDYTRGHVAYLPAGVSHAQTFGPLGARQVTLRPEEDWIDYLVDCKVPLAEAPHSNAAVFRSLGDRLVRELARKDDFTPLACRGLMLEVIAALGRTHRSPPPGRPPAWLRAAWDYIQENALRPVTLAEIAQAAGRHEIHLAREFSRHYGTTIGTCLRRQRTEYAADLLTTSDASLTEVALDSGFSSHSHLCREFKARLGIAPSAYRAQYRRGGR